MPRLNSFVPLTRIADVFSIEGCTDHKAWKVAQVRAGLEEADRGEFATATEMKAIFAKYML